ncbi:PRC-barrel domain-containing protein [Kribbella sp. NBC_00662]|uniref:PRC-barrel domain-containing protein n=1 Tax=Kribbella sp. NBC_00662 TaxID=2975969 RepID=UPI00324A081D
MSTFEPWSYREDVGYTQGTNIVGYKIAATDGDIGKIDKATNDVGAASIVVDTGPWILGRKVLLPAGVVQRIDHDDEKVYVDRTKDQIKDAPEYDPDASDYDDRDYRDRLGNYYGDYYKRGM